MIRRFILFSYIRICEKYLNLDAITQNTNTTSEFMANAWRHSGYREFVKKRNDDLIYEAAGGSGLSILDRAKYAELVGRRMENLYFATTAKKSFELEEQRKRQAINNPQKKQ